MTYIFKGNTHSDYSQEYMTELGMNEGTIEAAKSQATFELQRHAKKEQEWVVSELEKCDVMMKKIEDGDVRGVYTKEQVSAYRMSLRDYVNNDNGELIVNGDRPTHD